MPELHVASLKLRFVLFEQERADKWYERGVVSDDADDFRTPIDREKY